MSPTRAALALLCAAAGLAGTPARPAAQSQPDAPRIQFRDRTLPNGLRVLSARDGAVPTVAVQAWYGVGARDDPPGRSGLGHLIEHLMFQGSRNVGPSRMVQMAEDVGWPATPGSQSTAWVDGIAVYQEVPSSYLETFLWAEADRLAGLVPNDSLLNFEREAINEEIRGEFVQAPYGPFQAMLQRGSFTGGPYRYLDIGSIEELAGATLDEVRAHGARHFRPDNVVLVVVGDFDPARLDGWVDRYFGGLARPAEPLRRAPVEQPARTAEQRETGYGRVQAPAVALSFPTPGETGEDMAALRVARAVLAGDAQARLQRALVQGQPRLAAGVSASLLPRQGPGAFTITAVGTRESSAERMEQALRAEVARLRDEPVPAAELERAKMRMATEQMRRLETNVGKADALGQAAVWAGDPERVNLAVPAILAVTPADVQRVMQRYAAENRFYVLHFLPESARRAPAGGGTQGATTRGER
jgi:zinc protease